MAFIPQDEDDSNEVGMNVLAGQEQTIQPPVEQQDQQAEQQVTGGQSASIGGGQQLGSQSQPTAPNSKNQRGSGMFTDIRKYIQANKPAGGRLGSTVAKGIQKTTITPAQKLAEQSKRIQQNYAAQQQALGQVQQTTHQVGQQATQLVNPADLQARQQRLQSRVSALGDLQQGGYQQQIGGAQQTYQSFEPQVQQAQQAQEQAAQAYQQAQQAQQQAQQAFEEYKQQSPYSTIPNEDLQEQMRNWSQIEGMSQYAEPYNKLMASINQTQEAANLAQQEQAAKQQALQNLLDQQTSAQQQLQNLQDLQGKYERKQDLLSQISGIQPQLEGQTELDPNQLQQIRNFLSGEQKFDVGSLNTLDAKRQAQALADQVMGLENKSDIRKRLLRETFGDKYTRGMSGLDDIILARTGQIGKLQEASKQAAGDIKENINQAIGEQTGLREQLLQQVSQAKAQGQQELESNLANIMQNLETRAQTGDSGRLAELKQALTSPEGLSQKQLELFGGEQKIYGLDLQDAFQKAIESGELQAGDVVTGTEKSRINALKQLLGQEPDMDMTTAQPGEYSTAERNVFENIRNQIQERGQQYQSAQQQAINEVVSPWGEIAQPIAGELAGYAARGEIPSDDVLREIQSKNYWIHAGMGKHGWVLPIEDMKAMINRMQPKMQQIDQDFNIQNKKLKAFTEGEAAKDGLIKRNILKRLAGRG